MLWSVGAGASAGAMRVRDARSKTGARFKTGGPKRAVQNGRSKTGGPKRAVQNGRSKTGEFFFVFGPFCYKNVEKMFYQPQKVIFSPQKVKKVKKVKKNPKN